jgi:uncharacterized membrane protein YhaH (DUF805 family)
MNGQTDWSELFFSAHGRAARMPSLIATAALVILAAFYEAVSPSAVHWLTGWFVYPPLFYCGACVLSKRLHDRGRSGWWAALVLVSIVAVWPRPDSFFDFFFTLVLIWAGVDLGAMTGEAGTNRYGPNPLNPALSLP